MTDPKHPADLPPEAGKRPPFARTPEPGIGEIGTGQGYSGQEFDSKDQQRWRDEQAARATPSDGSVVGSGAGAGGGNPGEDFDTDSAGGDRDAPSGR